MSDDPKDPRRPDDNPYEGDDAEDWLAPDEDETAKRFQRPVHRDRFPELPDEEPETQPARLKEPPRPRPATQREDGGAAIDLPPWGAVPATVVLAATQPGHRCRHSRGRALYAKVLAQAITAAAACVLVLAAIVGAACHTVLDEV